MKKQIGQGVLGLLARLARGIVRKYSPKIVAVTGTVGKTTTKEAIYTVLAPYFDTAKSHQNANSEWGVVASVIDPGFDNFSYTDDGKARISLVQLIRLILIGCIRNMLSFKYPRILVLELGVDRPGDMAWFNKYLKYDVAVVTNIGHTHQEFFPSFERLIEEKLTIFKGLKDYGLAVINADSPYISSDARREVSFGDKGEIKAVVFGNRAMISFEEEEIEVDISGGRQFLPAMLIATAVAKEFALTPEQIQQGLSELKTIAGRFVIHKVGSVTLIDDAYNASPDSMKVALDSLQDVPGRKVAVLGEMKELGDYHKEGHAEVGKYAASRLDRLIAVAEGGRLIGEAALAAGMDPEMATIIDQIDIEKIGAVILDELRDNDVILVKASRSVGLDRLVHYLLKGLHGRIGS